MAEQPRIEVTLKGANKPPALNDFLARAMETAVARVQSSADAKIRPRPPVARYYVPRKPGYGPLKGSLGTHVEPLTRGWRGMRGVVGTPTYYARFLEYGAVGHYIAPWAKGHSKVLAIPTPGGGVVFRPYAHHPGVRAQFWMRSAAAESASFVQGLFETAAQQWTATLAVA